MHIGLNRYSNKIFSYHTCVFPVSELQTVLRTGLKVFELFDHARWTFVKLYGQFLYMLKGTCRLCLTSRQQYSKKTSVKQVSEGHVIKSIHNERSKTTSK